MKTFKKSLAVLTTAAILASSAAVVSYAAAADTITFPEQVVVNDGSADLKSGEQTLSDNGNVTLTIKLKDDFKDSYTLTVTCSEDITKEEGEDGTVTVKLPKSAAMDDTTSLTITAEKKGGGGVIVDPGAPVVWVNGKDVKDNKKTEADETKLYKTYKYEVTGMYSGGKWMVCVTDPAKTADEAALIADLNTNKGKLGKEAAAAGKLLATAKIKDGVVTVTAGKAKTDAVANVWVYEVKKGADAANPKNNAVVKTETIAPMKKEVTVLVANASPVIVDKAEGGAIIKGNKLELAEGATQEVWIAPKDDKKGTPSATNTYSVVTEKCKGDATAAIDGTKVTVTGGKEKTSIVLKCDQSGKTFKISVAAPKEEKKDDKTEAQTITFAATEVTKVMKGETEVKSGDAVAKDDELVFTYAEGVDNTKIEVTGATLKTDTIDTWVVSGTDSVVVKAKAAEA